MEISSLERRLLQGEALYLDAGTPLLLFETPLQSGVYVNTTYSLDEDGQIVRDGVALSATGGILSRNDGFFDDGLFMRSFVDPAHFAGPQLINAGYASYLVRRFVAPLSDTSLLSRDWRTFTTKRIPADGDGLIVTTLGDLRAIGLLFVNWAGGADVTIKQLRVAAGEDGLAAGLLLLRALIYEAILKRTIRTITVTLDRLASSARVFRQIGFEPVSNTDDIDRRLWVLVLNHNVSDVALFQPEFGITRFRND